jgi:hypothetical protein
MFTYRFYACVLTFCLGFGCALLSWAEDTVSPPPEAVVDTAKVAPSPATKDKADPERPEPANTDNSEDADLKQALVPENIAKNVSVHAYTRKSDQAKVSEYSLNGRVYMIKVKPTGSAPAYYLYDDNGDGTFNKRLPANYKHLNPPGWVLATF